MPGITISIGSDRLTFNNLQVDVSCSKSPSKVIEMGRAPREPGIGYTSPRLARIIENIADFAVSPTAGRLPATRPEPEATPLPGGSFTSFQLQQALMAYETSAGREGARPRPIINVFI